MTELAEKLAPYPSINAIVDAVLSVWPEHERYCRTRFLADEADFLERTEEFATLALKGADAELTQYASDYRWMCEQFLEEEFFFHREGRYRLSTFADAYREVYGNAPFMSRYVRGIMISQIVWDPHAHASDLFRTRFLPSIQPGSSYLEVGPGHGFFLAFASRVEAIERLEAWDVSPSSIAETKHALRQLGVSRDIALVEQDVLAAPARQDEFDVAVISEVLEHLERPDLALKSLYAALKSDGRIFINVPINSPAPDHIYLWRTPEELHQFIEDQGFAIEETHNLPQTGASFERAMKYNLMVSCIVIARKPA